MAKIKTHGWNEIDMATLMTWRTLDCITPIDIEIDGDNKTIKVCVG